jgi:hypothetical protein
MEQPIFTVVCRDGVAARVQMVEYHGPGGGRVLFGFRNTALKRFDRNGMANEGGDIWRMNGRWRYDGTEHPFDIVRNVPPSTINIASYAEN